MFLFYSPIMSTWNLYGNDEFDIEQLDFTKWEFVANSDKC